MGWPYPEVRWPRTRWPHVGRVSEGQRMTRRPLLLLAAILLAVLIIAAVLWCWVGLLRELSQVSTPIGQDAARATPTAASRSFARPVLPVSPDPAADQPVARTTSPTGGDPTPLIGKAGPSSLVTTQGPAVVVGKASTAGLSVWDRLAQCESRNQWHIN